MDNLDKTNQNIIQTIGRWVINLDRKSRINFCVIINVLASSVIFFPIVSLDLPKIVVLLYFAIASAFLWFSFTYIVGSKMMKMKLVHLYPAQVG